MKTPVSIYTTGRDIIISLRPEYLEGDHLKWEYELGSIDAPPRIAAGSCLRTGVTLLSGERHEWPHLAHARREPLI